MLNHTMLVLLFTDYSHDGERKDGGGGGSVPSQVGLGHLRTVVELPLNNTACNPNRYSSAGCLEKASEQHRSRCLFQPVRCVVHNCDVGDNVVPAAALAAHVRGKHPDVPFLPGRRASTKYSSR